MTALLQPTHTISILIVDDSELVRAGLRTILEYQDEESGTALHVAGEALSVASAIMIAARLKPDVVLLDIRLPDGSGLSCCRKILTDTPNAKVLILTSVIDDNLVYEAMSNGAHGYLLKEINSQGLRQSIIDVASGKFILDPALTSRVLLSARKAAAPQTESDMLSILSAQQRRLISLVAEGKTNKEIAEAMGLSDKTVKNYLSNIFEKLKISRRSQAAVLYLENRRRT